jgi:hypothetical protein
MSTSALEKDLRNDSHQFMSRMHIYDSEPTEQIPSPWHILPKKTTLSAPHISKLNCIPGKDFQNYTVENTINRVLTRMVLELETVDMEVKSEYNDNIQIRYVKYPGIAFVEHGDFIADTSKSLQHFDRTDFASYINKNCSGEVRKAKVRNLGERPSLTTWGKSLPSEKLIIEPPFLFNGNLMKAFPLYRAFRSNLEFRFKFSTKWSQFIRMRQMDDNGEWEEIPFNIKYIDSSSEIIPIPNAFATYRTIASSENAALLKFGSDSLFFNTYLNNDRMEIISARGGPVEHTLSCKFPSTSMLVLASIKSGKGLDYVNYVFPDGTNPIESVKIIYGTDERQEEIPSSIMEHDSHISIESPVPIDPGYNMIPTTEMYSENDFGSSVVYTVEKGAKMTVNFKTIPDGCDCFLKVRYQIVRQLVFEDGLVKLVEIQ